MNRPRFFPPSSGGSSAPRALSGWRARLASDPIPRLLREGSPGVLARVRRDLIDDSEAPTAKEIAEYPEVKAVLRKMEKSGGFAPKAPDKALGPPKFAAALASLRSIDRLADFGLRLEGADAAASPLHKMADYLLQSQEPDGGIADLALADTPKGRPKSVALHFQGWAVSALCRTGFEGDPRVEKGFQYLLERRQDDGGWAWRGVRTDSAARPSSHLVTGMVLRAFASAAQRRASREARRAAELLATRFLQPDRYEDRKAPSYWEILTEPRFYTDVLDALDTITAIGLGKENSGVRTAEAYLRSRQSSDGLWYPGSPSKPDGVSLRPLKESASKDKDKDKDVEAAIWLTLRVLVVLRRIN
jgi:prenyltransferase/squalene oxidase-like repeat protein